jgi:hypothetical protein
LPTQRISVSPKEAAELDLFWRGRSLTVFAEEILGIDLNPAQRRWFSLLEPGEDRWKWPIKECNHVAANQIGKTVGLAVIIIWACWNKIGVDISEENKWMTAAYPWYHVAPTQPQANIPLQDIRLLVSGDHPSQKRKCKIPKGTVVEKKLDVYYDGLEFWNGAQVQFRTTDEKAKALQGRRAAGISGDEVAFEDHLKSVINETLLMRLIAMGGPLILVSTPNGINDWYEVVKALQDEAMDREYAKRGDPLIGGSVRPGELLPIWVTPDGKRALVWSTVEDNIGFGIPREEADRMEATLDPATKEQNLRGAFLEPAEAYFVPSVYVTDAFIKGLPQDMQPEEGHQYVIAWDPSSSSDPSVGIVIDVTEEPWSGVHFRYYPKPIGDTKLLIEIYSLHALYNSGGATAITGYDETSMGGAMIKQSLQGLYPKKGVNFAGVGKKRDLLTNLRAVINAGKLVFPASWTVLERELLNYKLPDDKIKQDAVMATLIAAEIAQKGSSRGGRIPFRPQSQVTFVRKR